jgi:hypothetical protein
MKTILYLMFLLLAQASAMDPPVMEWEMQYYPSLASVFRDVHQINDGNLILGGRVWSGPKSFLVSMDLNGDTLWTCGNEWYAQDAYGVEELDDGRYIATGSCMEQSTASGALFIAKVDSSGTGIWSRVFDASDEKEEGYCVIALPDGGYAACGRINGTGLYFGQAWILRTNSQGDTLWTDIWGEPVINFAASILYKDGKLVVLVHGSAGELPYGSHLLFYDLDGNYLYGTSYPGVGGYAEGMCHASDGGFTFVTGNCSFPAIVHTDSEGNLLWSHAPQQDPPYVNHWYSISTTLDGGYVIAGTSALESPINSCPTRYDENHSVYNYRYGWLLRFDSNGVQLWYIMLNPGGNDEIEFYSARQLSEGGYIAAGYYNDIEGGTGVNGYIVRYAPETGIDEWEESTGETLSLRSWPNPASGPVQISLTGPEGLYSLTVHDLSGRLVREYPEVPLGGAAALVWDGLSDSGTSLPAGVYIAELHTTTGSFSTLLMRL